MSLPGNTRAFCLRPLVWILLVFLPLLGQCSHDPNEGQEGPWRHRLYTATYLTKTGDTWILIDTWHHRILYSMVLDSDLNNWHTLTENIGGPHSVATDGPIVLYDDTGYGNLRAARTSDVQTFQIDGGPGGNAEEYEIVFDVGTRPHRVIYDEAMGSFYAVASGSQEILRVTNDQGNLTVRHREKLAFLNGAYTRSLTIINGHMFFVTRSQGIVEATYRDDDFRYEGTHPVPEKFDDLNDIFLSSSGWYYITATPGGIARARSLEGFANGDYEDLSDVLAYGGGTPYYLSEVDGTLYLPLITGYTGIISFRDAETGPVTDIQSVFDFGPPEPANEWRKEQHPR